MTLNMMPSTETIADGCEALAARDPALAKAYARNGVPVWRSEPAGFQSLAQIIAYQQISTSAAKAIWTRCLDHFGGAIDAAALLQADIEVLRSCGLSGPKIKHMRSIALAIIQNRLDFPAIAKMNDASARIMLVAVKGIGPWTADIVLMSSFGRLDVMPHPDVGLMKSYRLLTGDAERPSPPAFAAKASGWSPYRAVAAHLLWAHINAVRATTA